MKAIIMAGGEGARLRPLTIDKPKPLMPILGKPVMRYAVELLHSHNIYDIAATIAYKGGLIRDEFGDSISYFEERTPLGTAGSVKNAASFLNVPFVVISGDALTDVDLSDAIAFHKENGAIATLVLKRVEEPLEYGVVVTDRKGRIKRFVEKPDWRHVLSDYVNTGIYILDPKVLDLIPESGAYDFGSQLFPRMVKEGYPIYGYAADCYWCDIGDTASYIMAQQDILMGKVNLNYAMKTHGKAVISEFAEINGPSYIGAGSFIDAGAKIEAGSVIGKNVYIGQNANIDRAVIWDGAHIGDNVNTDRCVIMDNVRIKSGASVLEGACIGSRSIIGVNAAVRPYVNVWPEQYILDDANVIRSVVDSNAVQLKNDIGVFTCALIPEEAAALGAALVSVCASDMVCVGFDSFGASSMLADAFITGAMSMGALTRRINSVTLPAVLYAGRMTGAKALAYFASNGPDTRLRLFTDSGEMSFGVLRKLMRSYLRLDKARAVCENIKPQLSDISAQKAYEEWKCAVIGKQEGHILYDIRDDKLILYDIWGQETGEETVERILDMSAKYLEEDKGMIRLMAKYDPEFAVSIIEKYVYEKGTPLQTLLARYSSFTQNDAVNCPSKAKGAAMRLIGQRLESTDVDSDGLAYSTKNGTVRIFPSNTLGRIELISSAANQEFADELIVDCKKVIESIMKEIDK